MSRPITGMSELRHVVNDSSVQMYGPETTLYTYYTCAPSYDYTSIECLKGKYDPCWSLHQYSMKGWKEYSVPKIIPTAFHSVYLKHKMNLEIISAK